jgi:HEAT repeat protein
MLRTILLIALLVVSVGCERSSPGAQYRGKPVQEWLQMLSGESDMDEAVKAMLAFEKITPEEARAVFPEVLAALRDPDSDVRSSAALILGNFTAVPEVVPALIEALRDADSGVRDSAAMSLKRFAPGANEAIPPLTEALRDADPIVRSQAAVALGSFGEAARGSVPAMISLLRELSPQGRVRVIGALGEIGPAAKDAVPALEQALEDKYTAEKAAEALKKIRQDP